ncbi:MAG TPA: hypothetical protein PLI56_00700, partial [Exilispira sp.]|nr:hypothetical protein [Exilispira sp.]
MDKKILNIKIPLIYHIIKHPGIQIEDIYKFIYQACFGIAHIFPSKDKFIEDLLYEIEQILKDSLSFEYQSKRYLLEYLKTDKSIARIDIYLYTKMNYSLEKLYLACLDACFEVREENKIEFITVWEDILNSFERKEKYFSTLSISKQSIFEFNNYIIKNNYPIISHSEIFKNLYKPSYRLVNPKNLNKIKVQTKKRK